MDGAGDGAGSSIHQLGSEIDPACELKLIIQVSALEIKWKRRNWNKTGNFTNDQVLEPQQVELERWTKKKGTSPGLYLSAATNLKSLDALVVELCW